MCHDRSGGWSPEDIAAVIEAHPDVDVAAARGVVAEFAQALEQPEFLDGLDRLVGS